MTDPTRSLRARLAAFFAVDDPWERRGGLTRVDALVGLVTLAVSVLLLEMTRSVGALGGADEPVWVQWSAVALGCVLLVGRRRWPLAVAALAAVHLFVAGVVMPEVMGQLGMQVVYFVAIFSGVAWARSRRDMLLVVGAVVVFMFAWLGWSFALGSGIDTIRESLGADATRRTGVLSPIAASVVITAMVNVLYFGGAIIGGQVAWRAARQRARLAEQAQTIAQQSVDLQHRAVLDERLRIARELHDVVAHHVSVIGIQAAAGRRVLTRDPVAASAALASVEESSREAVTQMRSLVGTLRDPGDSAAEQGGRSPEPGWSDLPALVEQARTPGLEVSYQLVEAAPGDAALLPAAVGLSVYRIAQEALTNVRRHSTASAVTIVLRVDATSPTPHAEIEVTDDGRPRTGTSGSGLGLLGVRERAASRRAEVEIGPRAVGGFRVRVLFPLTGVSEPSRRSGVSEPAEPSESSDLVAR